MDNALLNKKLKDRAISLGLCKQWTQEWESDESLDHLLKKYKRGLDFCIEHDYPNNEFIKAQFPEELRHKNLVFVDEEFDLKGENGVYVLNGNCDAHITFDGYAAATIYVRHDSKARIEAKGHAKVFVSVYDQSSVYVQADGSSKVYTYGKSKQCNVDGTGNWLHRQQNGY